MLDDSKVSIFGDRYTLKFTPMIRPGMDCQGLVNYYEHLILLDDYLSIPDVFSTFIHEILEIINKTCELNLPHQAITILETGLFSVIRSNPGILLPFLATEGFYEFSTNTEQEKGKKQSKGGGKALKRNKFRYSGKGGRSSKR